LKAGLDKHNIILILSDTVDKIKFLTDKLHVFYWSLKCRPIISLFL